MFVLLGLGYGAEGGENKRFVPLSSLSSLPFVLRLGEDSRSSLKLPTSDSPSSSSNSSPEGEDVLKV